MTFFLSKSNLDPPFLYIEGEKKFIGKVYDGLHRVSFLINEEGVIEHVFNKFKTKDHHEVVVNYLKENA